MKKKVLILARPDHSLGIHKNISNQTELHYATFNVFRSKGILSNIFKRAKVIDGNNWINLHLLTLYNQFCRLAKKININLFKYEDSVASKICLLYLNEVNYDVVHYWPVYFTNYVRENRRDKCKYVAEVYECNYLFTREIYKSAYEKNGFNYNYLEGKADRHKSLNEADIILVPSEFVKKSYESYVTSKIEVVDFGLLGRTINNTENTFNGSKLNLLFIGNASIEKGFELLVKASKKNANITITSIGAISKEIAKLDCNSMINYLGKKNHRSVLELVQQYDAVILPSYSDAFSMAIIEGLCAGKPVIVSSNCGNSDIIKQWKLGTVFDTGDLDDMMVAISKVAEDYSKFRDNVIAYQHYENINPYALRIENFYSKLL